MSSDSITEPNNEGLKESEESETKSEPGQVPKETESPIIKTPPEQIPDDYSNTITEPAPYSNRLTEINEVFILESAIIKPSDYLVLSVVNAIVCLFTGSLAFFFALPAFYFSLKTIELNRDEDTLSSRATSWWCLNLNLITMSIITTGFLLSSFGMYSWENWGWHLYYIP